MRSNPLKYAVLEVWAPHHKICAYLRVLICLVRSLPHARSPIVRSIADRSHRLLVLHRRFVQCRMRCATARATTARSTAERSAAARSTPLLPHRRSLHRLSIGPLSLAPAATLTSTLSLALLPPSLLSLHHSSVVCDPGAAPAAVISLSRYNVIRPPSIAIYVFHVYTFSLILYRHPAELHSGTG